MVYPRMETPTLLVAYDKFSDQAFNEALVKRGMDSAKTKSSFHKNKKLEPVYPNGTAVVFQEKRNSQGKTGCWKKFGTIVPKRPHGPSATSILTDVNILLVNYF